MITALSDILLDFKKGHRILNQFLDHILSYIILINLFEKEFANN